MISVKFSTQSGGRATAVIAFRPYNEAGVDIIRSVSGARYNSAERSWAIAAHRLPKALEQLHQAGLAISINKKIWSPPPPAPPDEDDPLVGVLRQLPQGLVQPTVLALARTWDDSDEWMLRLHEAMTTVAESGGRVRRLRRRVTA